MKMHKDKLFYFLLISFLFGEAWSDCGITKFTNLKGVIKSPDYVVNTSCSYQIDVSANSRWVRLNWDNFVMDAKMHECSDGDHIEVYVGCNSSKTSVSRFCTRNMKTLPHTIYAADGCIEIEYRKSKGGPSNVFSATYEAFPIDTSSKYSTGCSRSSKIKRYSGTILSPSWPHPYGHYNFPWTNECEWDIQTGSNSKVIKLNFMDLDIYDTGSTGSCYNDKVLVRGKKSGKTSHKETWQFCGKKSPFSIITSYYELEIEMAVSRFTKSYTSRGFVVGFVAYDDDEAGAVLGIKWEYIFGIIIVLAVITIGAFFCFRSYKQRQSVSQTVTQGFDSASNTYPKSQGYPQQYIYPQQQVYQHQVYQQQQIQSAYPPLQGGYRPQTTYPVKQDFQSTPAGANQPVMYPYTQTPYYPYQGNRDVPPSLPPPPYSSGSQQIPYQPPQ